MPRCILHRPRYTVNFSSPLTVIHYPIYVLLHHSNDQKFIRYIIALVLICWIQFSTQSLPNFQSSNTAKVRLMQAFSSELLRQAVTQLKMPRIENIILKMEKLQFLKTTAIMSFAFVFKQINFQSNYQSLSTVRFTMTITFHIPSWHPVRRCTWIIPKRCRASGNHAMFNKCCDIIFCQLKM